MDVGRPLPDLHIDGELRVVDVDGGLGEGPVEKAPHLLGELDGVQGEALVRPLALHLEVTGLRELRGQVDLGGLHDGGDALLAGDGPDHADDAENLGAGVVDGVHIRDAALRLHIDGALAGVDAEGAQGPEAAGHVGHELILKMAAVEPLEHHLAQLQEEELRRQDGGLGGGGFDLTHREPPGKRPWASE